jgi:hypothetical protein
MFLLHPILGEQVRSGRVFRQRLVGWKPGPVLPVNLLVGTPLGMLCNERIFAADYFTLKVRGEAWMIFS